MTEQEKQKIRQELTLQNEKLADAIMNIISLCCVGDGDNTDALNSIVAGYKQATDEVMTSIAKAVTDATAQLKNNQSTKVN